MGDIYRGVGGGRKKKKEKGIHELKSGVQGQTVFMLHPLFKGRLSLPLKKQEPGGTHHISHTRTHTYIHTDFQV